MMRGVVAGLTRKGQTAPLLVGLLAAVLARILGLTGVWPVAVLLITFLGTAAWLHRKDGGTQPSPASRYSSAWVRWSGRWRSWHVVALGLSIGLGLGAALASTASSWLSIGLLAAAVLAVAVTPLASPPLFGSERSSDSMASDLRAVVRAHREGKVRAAAARQERLRDRTLE